MKPIAISLLFGLILLADSINTQSVNLTALVIFNFQPLIHL